MSMFELALQDVLAVRKGFVAGGCDRLHKTVSYPNNASVLARVASLVSLVYTSLQLNNSAQLEEVVA